MNTRSRLAVALSLTFASAGCAAVDQADAEAGADACVPTAMIPAAACAEGVLSRRDEPTTLIPGSATVLRLHVEPDGRASLSLESGAVATTLSLPAAPRVAVGDLLTVELDPLGATILRSDGDLVAYIGPHGFASPGATDAPVDRGAMLEANREGTPLSVEVAGVPLTLEAVCGGWVEHSGSVWGCGDVPMAAFSVRYQDTTVAPGARALAPLADRVALAIENRGVWVPEEASCGFCGDLGPAGFGVTLVVTAAE